MKHLISYFNFKQTICYIDIEYEMKKKEEEEKPNLMKYIHIQCGMFLLLLSSS